MIDRYTKAVLTVIAVCLCLITAQNLNIVPSAEAYSHDSYKVQRFALCEPPPRSGCALIIDGALATIAK